MPRKQMPVERWQVSIVFVLVVATFVIGLKLLSDQVHANHKVAASAQVAADSAKASARRTKAALAVTVREGVIRRRKIAESDLQLCQNVYGSVGGALIAIIAAQEQQATFQFYRSALPSLSDQEITNLVRIARDTSESEKTQLRRAFDIHKCSDLPSQAFAAK